MKFTGFLFLLFAITACKNEAAIEKSKNPELLKQEVFKTSVGKNEVYGVRLIFSGSERPEFKYYVVTLSQNEKVWMDTLTVEIPQRDTVENELIFSEAVVAPGDLVELRLETLEVNTGE